MKMVSITFENPVFLWLILLVPLMYIGHYLFLYRTQTKALRFANFIALKRISGEKFVTKNITVLILRTLIIILLILSLSQTTLWYEGIISDYDYVIAIDVSPSMITKDLELSRIEFAKESANNLIEKLNTQAQFGLISFSGLTYILNPLSENTLNLRINLNSLNVSKSTGTDISNAIVASTNVLLPSKKGKAIILFTDGANTVGPALDNSVKDAINYAKLQNVKIHAVGLGTNNAPVGYLPEMYNLKSGIDKDNLDYITSQTGGLSFYPTRLDELNEFYLQLSQENQEGKASFKFEFYGLLFAFILIFVEWILINLIFRRVA
ncbi:MAG: VWA domain-containing protein [Candidatus Woesearchaeota archaeon]